MSPFDWSQMSFEEFMAFIIAHFQQQEHTLEQRQPAPAGQVLLFRCDGVLSLAYCVSNLPLPGELWAVNARDVRWCITATENLTAACGYVITRGYFSYGAEKEAKYAGLEIVLVNGRKLEQWYLSLNS